MARRLVSLLTSGDDAVTGGHLYNRHMAALAAHHGVLVESLAVSSHFDLTEVPGQVVVDSLVASAVLPGLPDAGNPPITALVHQLAGGVTGTKKFRRAQRLADLALYRRCELVIAASAYLGGELVAAGIPEGRIRIVSPGRDLPALGIAPAADLRLGRKLALLNVANWLPNKGILELLDIVGRLPAGEVVLHLVGSPDLDPKYAQAIRSRLDEPELRAKVVQHGVVPQGQLSRLYAGADLLVLTSREEGYGTVVAEGLGVGLPVIAWHSGNIPNLFDDGKEGFLIPTGHIGAFAGRIRLAQDEELRVKLSAAAAVRGAKLPTWEQSASLFFAELKAVAGAGHPAPAPTGFRDDRAH